MPVPTSTVTAHDQRRRTESSWSRGEGRIILTFMLEHVLRRGTVRTVDPEHRHQPRRDRRARVVHKLALAVPLLLALPVRTTRDLLRELGRASEPLAKSTRKVAHLADVHRDVGVVGRGGDREGVPLECRDLGYGEIQPLACDVREGGLVEADLHRARGMHEHAHNLGLATGANLGCQTGRAMRGTYLAVHALDEVGDAAPDRPAPRLVPDALDRLSWQRAAHKAARCTTVIRNAPTEEGDVLAWV